MTAKTPPAPFRVGDLVWARADEFPWWPGRVVTRPQLRLAPMEPEPDVPEGHMLVQFFNDNNRFEVMHMQDVKVYRNTSKGINEGYKGEYEKALAVAVQEMERSAKEMGWTGGAEEGEVEEGRAEDTPGVVVEGVDGVGGVDEMEGVEGVEGGDVEFVFRTAEEETRTMLQERGVGGGDVVYLDQGKEGGRKESVGRSKNEPASDNTSTESVPINEDEDGEDRTVGKVVGKRKAVGLVRGKGEEDSGVNGKEVGKRKKKARRETGGGGSSIGTAAALRKGKADKVEKVVKADKANKADKMRVVRGGRKVSKKDSEVEELRKRVQRLEDGAGGATAMVGEKLVKRGIELMQTSKEMLEDATEMIRQGQELVSKGV